MIKTCNKCSEEYFIESPEFPSSCPTCALNIAFWGEPQKDGTRSKGIFNNGPS